MKIQLLSLITLFSFSSLHSAENRGTPIGWLRAGIDKDTGLVRSYAEKPGFWLYSQTLAVIAFSESGGDDVRRAKRILSFFKRNSDSPKSDEAFCYFSVSETGKVDKGYRTTATNAWLVMAINYYEAKTGDRSFAPFAEDILRWIQRNTLQTFEKGSAVSMADTDQASTEHDEREVFSTEHQLDCVSAFLYRYHLSGDKSFYKTAMDIHRFIKEVLWDGERVFGGYRRDNGVNKAYYLDANCWGVLALGNWIEPGMWINEEKLVVKDRKHELNGHSVSGVTGYTEWHGSKHYWTEGTESMVAAWIMLGNEEKAKFYHDHTRRFAQALDKDPNDDALGIPFSCQLSEETSTSESVAGTTWFFYNEKRINPFRPTVRLRPLPR